MGWLNVYTRLFLDVRKKTQGEKNSKLKAKKTQNSRKKLKLKLKTQKVGTFQNKTFLYFSHRHLELKLSIIIRFCDLLWWYMGNFACFHLLPNVENLANGRNESFDDKTLPKLKTYQKNSRKKLKTQAKHSRIRQILA